MSVVEGFFIRKREWKQLDKLFPEFIIEIKRQFLSKMVNVFQPIMLKAKSDWNLKYQSRADYKSIFMQQDYDQMEL